MVGAFQSPSRLVKHCSNPEELLVGWRWASLLLKIAVAKQLHFGLLLQSKAVSGSCFPDLQVQGTVCYMISSTAGIRTCSRPGTYLHWEISQTWDGCKFGFWEKQCISLSHFPTSVTFLLNTWVPLKKIFTTCSPLFFFVSNKMLTWLQKTCTLEPMWQYVGC
jgi:hypothetical protein